MSTLFYALVVIFPAVALTALAVHSFKKHMQGMSGKKIMKTNLAAFAVVVVLTVSLAFSAAAAGTDDSAQAADTQTTQTTAVQTDSKSDYMGLGLLAAGLVTGLAGIGGGIAVAAGAPAAIAATSEDPKSFGKSLIFVALGESIALYGVVISILILNKL